MASPTDPPGDESAEFAATIVDGEDPLAATIAASRDHTTDVASPRARAIAESGKTLIAHGSLPIASGPDGTLATLGPREDADFGARYSGGKLLGRGGMGEVRQYLDAVVGRNVAIKFLRTKAVNAEAKARFVREARVQGQLQHPAVVPVYDLGLSTDGETFFTMKRLGGRTLGEILKELRGSDPEVVSGKRRQLLTAFSDVCLAVDYAHTRGVVHRDLKPANIMLGDFGEVYVLDWGLARLADDADDHAAAEAGEDDSMRESGKIEAAVGITSANLVMGTVGYMAPEQLLGEPIGIVADVYALGAILFEILALEPLHHGSTTEIIAVSTIEGAGERIRQRASVHGIAPELERLCTDATELDVGDRTATARELYTRLEGYLAGDRDLARRREMAEELASEAGEAATRALADSDLEARRQAMRVATRALALDPEQSDAPRVLMKLLLSPPTETPDEVTQLLDDKRRRDNRQHARLAAAGYGSWLVALPLFLWMGIVDWTLGSAMVGSVLVCSAASLVGARGERVSTALLVVGTFMNAATLFLLTRLLGPLILVPTLAVSTSLAFTLYGRRIATILGPLTAVLAIVLAVVGEAAGIIPRSYAYEAGELHVISQVLVLRPVATTITLTALVAAAVLVAAWFVATVRRSLDRAEAENMTMLWQYRQLVPESDEQ